MTGIAVIVHSFNRPRMLREALSSVVAGRPEQVIVADDGSDFDVASYCDKFGATLVAALPLTATERLTVARQGVLLNAALGLVTQEVVTMLCDDDLHHPDWYDCARAWFDANPDSLYARGDWGIFNDGETPAEDGPLCTFPDARMATSGNFAHRIGLVREHGCRWPVDAQLNLDDRFLWSLQRHLDTFRPVTVGFAGWRRLHPAIAGHYATGYQFNQGAARLMFERGFLE